MSHNDCILNMLNLKDKNVIFYKNFFSEMIIKDKKCFVYHAKLSHIPDFCPCCGVVYDNSIIVKHGFKLSKIILPSVSKFNTYLFLDKQRFKCRSCNKTFSSSTNIVAPSCFISNNTKCSITVDLGNKMSEKDIAKFNNVSPNTVERVLDSYYDKYKVVLHKLPECLSFDEFKSVKEADGNMSFNMCNALTGKTLDIIENRQLNYLIKYFHRYPLKVRQNVKHIVIDMYSPYISLIKKLFPNANIIIDKFHIVQLISRSLNKTRIAIMNKDKKNYNKLKRYWKLLLKYSCEINNSKWHKWTCFDRLMTEQDVVNFLVNINQELKATYNLYQELLHSIKTKNKTYFDSIIEKSHPSISSYMITSLNTLIDYKDYIHNSLDSNLTNGFIEGNNNLIKTIKRIAFGFRSFLRFKARIMIISDLLRHTKKEAQELLS